MTNVVELKNNFQARVEEEIVRALEGRVHWVSEPFVLMAGSRSSNPNVNIFDVMKKMIREGKMDKTFLPVSTPDGGAEKLPHYRLAR